MLESNAVPRTVDRRSSPVRAAPDPSAEQVTAALYASPVRAFDSSGDWRRVRVADGYVGWVRADHLTERATSGDPSDVLRRDVPRDDVPGGFLPAGTACFGRASNGSGSTVRFRTGLETTVPDEAVTTPSGAVDGAAVVRTARQFLDTPYRWGGLTSEGIDCSGLVWTSYRVHGLVLPRDSDQQRRVGRSVDRDELRPGDLLFFPGHVGMSTGGLRFIHAHGDSDGVVEGSLDPPQSGYVESLDDSLACCRRIG